jgi:hypothetical protein
MAMGPSCAKPGVRMEAMPRRFHQASVSRPSISIMRSGMKPPPL